MYVDEIVRRWIMLVCWSSPRLVDNASLSHCYLNPLEFTLAAKGARVAAKNAMKFWSGYVLANVASTG